jgi:hypothetical protein
LNYLGSPLSDNISFSHDGMAKITRDSFCTAELRAKALVVSIGDKKSLDHLKNAKPVQISLYVTAAISSCRFVNQFSLVRLMTSESVGILLEITGMRKVADFGRMISVIEALHNLYI